MHSGKTYECDNTYIVYCSGHFSKKAANTYLSLVYSSDTIHNSLGRTIFVWSAKVDKNIDNRWAKIVTR